MMLSLFYKVQLEALEPKLYKLFPIAYSLLLCIALFL